MDHLNSIISVLNVPDHHYKTTTPFTVLEAQRTVVSKLDPESATFVFVAQIEWHRSRGIEVKFAVDKDVLDVDYWMPLKGILSGRDRTVTINRMQYTWQDSTLQGLRLIHNHNTVATFHAGFGPIQKARLEVSADALDIVDDVLVSALIMEHLERPRHHRVGGGANNIANNIANLNNINRMNIINLAHH